ncbi:hypothetical protein KP004_03675 [Geomonas oryzisoli]|uniref:DUF1294 domain-containing protein n=1 Tax=Geomonas oryzisoli TaxID=2847992 RepID=A0ABX8J7I1_9BACT|nr:hypothetical protein [Geomonas oryzisoli]QWV94295.1 hypothetical protein KP004_03675 [Geomonas oryzisoli]
MHKDEEIFARIALVISGLCIILLFALKPRSPSELLDLISRPTIAFLPTWYVIQKHQLFKKLKNSTQSQAGALLGLVVGAMVTRKFSTHYQIYLVIYGFEVLCLYYFIRAKGKIRAENS